MELAFLAFGDLGVIEREIRVEGFFLAVMYFVTLDFVLCYGGRGGLSFFFFFALSHFSFFRKGKKERREGGKEGRRASRAQESGILVGFVVVVSWMNT